MSALLKSMVIGALLLSQFTFDCQAQTNSQLEQIRLAVDSESLRLKDLDQKITIARPQLVSLQSEVKDLKKRLVQIKSAVTKLVEEKSRLEQEVTVLENRSKRLQNLLADRLKVLYMFRPRDLLTGMAMKGQAASASKVAFYFSKIDALEKKLIRESSDLVRQKNSKRGELDKIIQRETSLNADLDQQNKKLEAQLAAQQQLVISLEAEKKQRQDVLDGLRAQSLRLETVVLSLTADQKTQLKFDKANGFKMTTGMAPGGSNQPYSGPGLVRKRVKLPVEGILIKKFGKNKMEGFTDFVLSKGLEYACDPDGNVIAVAAGRVAYAGQMPAYGNVIIIDHGHRHYSLYGKLYQNLVNPGDLVKQSQTIGELANPDERGSNFYFEIRENGIPVNPQKYL